MTKVLLIEDNRELASMIFELFGNMYEAQILTNRWVKYYNEIRPHSSLGGRPPAPQTMIPLSA